MSLTRAQAQALKAVAAKRSPAQLKALFALIRANNDRTLFAALKAPKRKPPGDALRRELQIAMAPILGPASEKAELLVEHLGAKHRRQLHLAPKGLADAARALRAHFTDAQIRAGAATLMHELAKTYSMREPVV